MVDPSGIPEGNHFFMPFEGTTEFTPVYNGIFNKTPAKYFKFYEYNPLLGTYINTDLKRLRLPITGLNLLFNDTSTDNEQ